MHTRTNPEQLDPRYSHRTVLASRVLLIVGVHHRKLGGNLPQPHHQHRQLPAHRHELRPIQAHVPKTWSLAAKLQLLQHFPCSSPPPAAVTAEHHQGCSAVLTILVTDFAKVGNFLQLLQITRSQPGPQPQVRPSRPMREEMLTS